MKMICSTALLVGLGSGLLVRAAQPPTSTGAFTSAQTEAGRVAYERTCGQCHTMTLMGRKGDPGELPPLGSLSASYQKFIGPRGFVAPLAGKVFLARWGGKTAAQLITRFQETVDDPYFKFENMTDETTVDITAYVLGKRSKGRIATVDAKYRRHRRFDHALIQIVSRFIRPARLSRRKHATFRWNAERRSRESFAPCALPVSEWRAAQ